MNKRRRYLQKRRSRFMRLYREHLTATYNRPPFCVRDKFTRNRTRLVQARTTLDGTRSILDL